jgi:DNA-binding response OmpR family regulator
MKILIIDDEAHIRQMMRLTLEASGYEVEEAANGEEGLARFARGGVDAIVLDQKMPGIDGLETLRRLNERAPDACVLMVTAFASIELAVDAMKLGATDFLRKPMTPEALRSAVAAALARRPVPRRPARGAMAETGGRPRIETLTLNGFQILRPREPADRESADHVFRVRRPSDGVELEVTVTIDPAIIARVERLSRRTLRPGGAFWRGQAERMLAAYLWSEGRAPESGHLTVHDVSREDIEAAAVWQSD